MTGYELADWPLTGDSGSRFWQQVVPYRRAAEVLNSTSGREQCFLVRPVLTPSRGLPCITRWLCRIAGLVSHE